MKKIFTTLLVLVLMMASVAPGHARGGGYHRGGGWGWGPALGVGLLGLGLWEISRPHYYPPPEQRIYVQPVPQQPTASYWYYCRQPEGYYPYVTECPTGWMKVLPTPPVPYP